MISTDPDAPSRANPVRREFRHWLVGNIPDDRLDQGQTLTEYVGSGPPKDTGRVEHFILLVCTQVGASNQKNFLFMQKPTNAQLQRSLTVLFYSLHRHVWVTRVTTVRVLYSKNTSSALVMIEKCMRKP
jgi:phosphatidylethanolamine-binding protein (PEBP) family uncharacterized protein